jgi:putative DNA primase/helicase
VSASLDLHHVQRLHGGVVYDGGRRWVGPGPGHSRRDQSLSVWITDEDRTVVHSFAGDAFDACLSHLGVERGEVKPADRFTVMRQRAERAEAARRQTAADEALCARIWSETVPAAGTPAEAYLWSRNLVSESSAVRFHPDAPRSKRPGDARAWPAMVCLVTTAHGQPQALHLTYLVPDGSGKAFGDRSRLMFGATTGCAVQLDAVADGVLAVGEGVETSAAFGALKGVPAWAALSTSGLQAFILPPGVKRLLIAADSDDGGAGLKAANALAERAERLCAVEIHPAPPGKDWNDMAVPCG